MIQPMPRLPTDIRIEFVDFAYEDFRYRSPIKFGGVALDRVTLLNATVGVRTLDGNSAIGHGSMPMGNVWSFPSRVLSYDQTLGAMKLLAFVPSLHGSAGTAHMVGIARAAGIPVHVFGPTGRISGWGQSGTCGR